MCCSTCCACLCLRPLARPPPSLATGPLARRQEILACMVACIQQMMGAGCMHMEGVAGRLLDMAEVTRQHALGLKQSKFAALRAFSVAGRMISGGMTLELDLNDTMGISASVAAAACVLTS